MFTNRYCVLALLVLVPTLFQKRSLFIWTSIMLFTNPWITSLMLFYSTKIQQRETWPGYDLKWTIMSNNSQIELMLLSQETGPKLPQGNFQHHTKLAS